MRCRSALVAVVLAAAAFAADVNLPAELVVTDVVAKPREKVPPLGANNWGGAGAIEYAANNLFQNSGNEPVTWRNLHRVKACGPDWFELDGPGTSWWDLWGDGFLSGADLRIYRLVDQAGQPAPLRPDGNNVDAAAARGVALVGRGRVLPAGSPGHPNGGWVVSTWGDVHPNSWIRGGNLSVTDTAGLVPGQTYYYTVLAVAADNAESPLANEVSVVAQAPGDEGPHLLVSTGDDKLPELKAGTDFRLVPKVFGGRAPLVWSAEGLPAGLNVNPSTGEVAGRPTAAGADVRLRLKVTDAGGRSDSRAWVANATAPTDKSKPQPASGVKATAGQGCVVVTWQASPSANVLAYRLRRATAPNGQQQQRVYVTADTPPLRAWDYVVVSRRFGNFAMQGVHPRVRGIGNPPDQPDWYWRLDAAKAKASLVPHPQPVPAAMTDPGETCMLVEAAAGEQALGQFTFIGTKMGGEALWYGQLEPGRKYHLEAWLRQDGLANGGTVTFSFGRGYPELHTDFKVTSQWARYEHDLVGPPRPEQGWHFGPHFTFTGPGKLWLDNCRLFRYDSPDELQRPYTPNRTVLDELLAAQPATGPKGAHRIWFLSRDATMDSILSWHASSKARPDWRTAVDGTLDMTLPMGLSFDLATGDSPATRMRPWLVMQHILHSEADWQAFVEYLAAPFDPAKDSPQSKPWAARRFAQRGTGRPWTDEFATIVLEFGNETWHNGVFEDWLGFSTRNAVHQGGREYGLFCQYLIDQLKRSPYWAAQKLDGKLRFALGANYDCRTERDGSVHGYGEEAMQACPGATILGHANYVGPKWETGDYSARNYDDHGVEECLLSFLTGPETSQIAMGKGREALIPKRGDYDIAAYEGGPGGFALPGSAPADQVETNEKYGKSLAQAVGAFDAWMRSYLYGWTWQCYLAYGQGTHWNSHTLLGDGFRPGPAWQALTLRNRLGSGDLMAVEERAVPTLHRGKADYPLVGAYALRDGTRWTVFVVSRKLDGKHDGVDFGDGKTPVTLRLPFKTARSVTLTTLTGDPRQTNREKLAIEPKTVPVAATALADGVLKVDLPAGSIYGYVFEGTAG